MESMSDLKQTDVFTAYEIINAGIKALNKTLEEEFNSMTTSMSPEEKRSVLGLLVMIICDEWPFTIESLQKCENSLFKVEEEDDAENK